MRRSKKPELLLAGVNDRQLSIQFFFPQAAETPATGGDNACDAIMRQAIGDSLAGLDRDEVAAQMSAILGRKIEKAQLDQWCAPSQSGRRAHGDAILALMKATNSTLVLERMSAELEMFVVTQEDVKLAEYGAKMLLGKALRADLAKDELEMAQSGAGRKVINKMKNRG